MGLPGEKAKADRHEGRGGVEGLHACHENDSALKAQSKPLPQSRIASSRRLPNELWRFWTCSNMSMTGKCATKPTNCVCHPGAFSPMRIPPATAHHHGEVFQSQIFMRSDSRGVLRLTGKLVR